MKYGLPAATIQKMHAVLARFPRLEKAVLYGSRAKGTYKPGSDIDLTLFGEDLDSSQLGKIAEALDDLSLPYTIDLSLYADLNHAKLREHIDRIGVVFYERGGNGNDSAVPERSRRGAARMKKGWPRRNLGDLCDVVGGGTPSKDNPAFYSGQIPWATVRDMRQDIITETDCRITKEAVENSATHIIPAANVVIATRVGLGKVCLLGQDTAINQDLRGIIPHDTSTLSVRFLFCWLKTMADVIIAEGTGATVKGVKLPFVKSLKMPVPPLPEQQRIVGVLDEAFAGLATAKANAEKNLQNARALFESHLNEVFSKRAEGWVETTIGDQLTLQRGFDITKAQQNPGGVPVVSSGGIKSYHDKAIAKGPGVVIGRKGTLGKVFFMENDFWPHDTTLWVKDFKGNEPRFVYYLFSGLDVKKLDSGAANPALNRNQVHPIAVTWPRVDQQKTLVETLDALEDETQRLARLYSRKLAALEALKKSLLHQAFAGEL